ncbi:MAG: hypothetical protein ACRC20_10130 [Segniliparus sp.]|uniref:hypothetical protein n=1 Tax=Segniliparus sp. TaxID=2804064 RepID=UPI003F340E45
MMSSFGKAARAVCAAAFGVVAFGGLASTDAASAAAPRLTGDGSSYGPCYYNPVPCNTAQQGKNNPYAKLPLPNSKPDNSIHILPPKNSNPQ